MMNSWLVVYNWIELHQLESIEFNFMYEAHTHIFLPFIDGWSCVYHTKPNNQVTLVPVVKDF